MHRRKLFIIPLILVLLAGLGAAGSLAHLNAQFSEVNSLSTPPPQLPSDLLGGDKSVTIDTSPAQDAVRQAELAVDSSDVDPESNVVSAQEAPVRDAEIAVAGSDDDDTPGGNAVTAQEEATAPPAPVVIAPTTVGSVTILLMGVDAREGEAIDVGVRPDTLAVLHLDGETGSCRLLSIPRDTRTELPGYGQSKVNHALAVGGVPYQVLVTQNLLGIEIDHYGLIDFNGIEGLVDAVGGVTVDNESAFTNISFTFDEGTITLNGEEALAFARYRGGPDGDFGRIERQQQIVRALIGQTSGMDVATGAYDLLGAVEGHVRTDLSIIDLIGLANDYRSTCTEATLELDNLDGTVGTFPDPLLNLDLSYVIVDPAEVEQKVDWLLGEP